MLVSHAGDRPAGPRPLPGTPAAVRPAAPLRLRPGFCQGQIQGPPVCTCGPLQQSGWKESRGEHFETALFKRFGSRAAGMTGDQLVNINGKWRWLFQGLTCRHSLRPLRISAVTTRCQVSRDVAGNVCEVSGGKTVLGDFAFMDESRSMYMLMASTCLWAQINFGIREKTLHLESVGQSLGCLLWNFLSLLSLPRGAWALGAGRWATRC